MKSFDSVSAFILREYVCMHVLVSCLLVTQHWCVKQCAYRHRSRDVDVVPRGVRACSSAKVRHHVHAHRSSMSHSMFVRSFDKDSLAALDVCVSMYRKRAREYGLSDVRCRVCICSV
jgi:hypothetical protein